MVLWEIKLKICIVYLFQLMNGKTSEEMLGLESPRDESFQEQLVSLVKFKFLFNQIFE